MDSKTAYETAAAVAAALPESEREMFAELLTAVTSSSAVPRASQARAARRWLRDAGWAERR